MQPKVRYTDTSFVIAQQWETGREKTTFPNVYAYDYNRKKFENLARVDRMSSFRVPKIDESNRTKEGGSLSSSSGERKQRKRKAIDRNRRHGATDKDVELSDSDDEQMASSQPHRPAPPVPSTQIIVENLDEVDRSAPVEEGDIISATDGTTNALYIDSVTINNDATDCEKSPLPLDEVLLIDDSDDVIGTFGATEIIVDIHSEPDTIILEIREDEDDDPQQKSAPADDCFVGEKLSKHPNLDDVVEIDDENVDECQDQKSNDNDENAEPATTNKCDINENLINDDVNDKCENAKIVVDHNHNDIGVVEHCDERETVSIEKQRDAVNRNEARRISISSRSSFDESDGMESDATYASIDKNQITVSWDRDMKMTSSAVRRVVLQSYETRFTFS